MHTVTYHLMEIHSKPTSHADDTNDTHRKRGVVWGVGQERLGPPYFFISLVLDPLNSLVWYVSSLRYTRGIGWRMHCGAEVTESSTNRQHHFISPSSKPELGPVVCKQFCISLDASRRLNKNITGASPPRLSIAPPRADRCWSPCACNSQSRMTRVVNGVRHPSLRDTLDRRNCISFTMKLYPNRVSVPCRAFLSLPQFSHGTKAHDNGAFFDVFAANRPDCPRINLLGAIRTKSIRTRFIQFGFVQFRSHRTSRPTFSRWVFCYTRTRRGSVGL